MVFENLDIHMKKMNLDTDLTALTNSNSQLIIALRVKCEDTKLMVENIGKST